MKTEWDRIPERGRSLEDEYFRRRDRELVEQARGQAADAGSRRHFAAAIGMDSEPVLTALRRAGVDERTAALLPIVPAVYVAWADGRISDAERREIDLLFRSADVKATGPLGQRLLATWLARRPSDGFFAAALVALKARLEQLDLERRVALFRRMIADAVFVATTSGGLLGFGAVSDAEFRAVRDLQAALQIDT